MLLLLKNDKNCDCDEANKLFNASSVSSDRRTHDVSAPNNEKNHDCNEPKKVFDVSSTSSDDNVKKIDHDDLTK